MNFLQNLPSFRVLFIHAWDTAKRFPYAILSAISATIFSLILSESDKISDEFVVQKLLLVSLLGLPLFIALRMLAEKYQWNFWKSFRLQTIGFLLLVLYYVLMPHDFYALEKHIVQYTLLYAGCLFLNAFIPYLKEKNVHRFWQYNKSLFLGFLTAVIYSLVMVLGLIIALAALDHLFNMDIDEKRYLQIWIIVSILFNTWVFLAKLPSDLDLLENEHSYPKGLKVFTQYILLPLVGLYLFILYAYEIKILIEWNLPIGWVSNLILWFSVVSILSLLLLHPLRELKENKWIQVFSKWFFRAMLPLVAMLFMAIIQRISDYGITEARYVVFAMAVGLAVVVLYFVISKTKDIRIIPIVISLLAFVSAMGPWSATAVSKNSQQSHLEMLLVKNNLLHDGKLVSLDEAPNFDSRKEMSSVVDYLLTMHGVEALSVWGADTVLQTLDTNKFGRISEKDICTHLGFKYQSRWDSEGDRAYYTLNIDKKSDINITEFDKLFYLKGYAASIKSKYFIADSLDCHVQYDSEKVSFALYIGDSLSTYDDLGEIDLSDTLLILSELYDKREFQSTNLSFSFIGKFYEAKIIFFKISGFIEENSSINGFTGVLLLKKK